MNMGLGESLHLKTRENGRGFQLDGLFKRKWFDIERSLGKADEFTECFCKLIFYDCCVQGKPEGSALFLAII